MITLLARSYANERDLQPIADLLNTCEAIDREENYYSTIELQQQVTSPDCNPDRDLRLWYDNSGQLIAFGQLWIPSSALNAAGQVDSSLWFRVHPDFRYQGLEAEIITWAEAVLRDVAADGVPLKLLTPCRSQQQHSRTLLEQHGFTIERQFSRMRRSLHEPIPLLQLPNGFTLKTGTEFDFAAWVEMFNQTFVDHWNFHPLTIEEFKHEILNDPRYRPDLDLAAVAADGTYAAFCYGWIDPETNQQQNRLEGHISALGTRREFRRLGLGRAMLLAALRRLKAAGMEIASLNVDEQNSNQAQQLYHSVGFRPHHTTLHYSKCL
jgi:ribosomal protein S18 acetylase RimI-like enzyme